jgi:predicted ATPase
MALLGPAQVTLDGQPVAFAYSKARALLLYLAVEADRPHQRETLVTLLWPELPETAARTNLRQALANLREALGDASAAVPFLLITRETLQFNRHSVFDLDVTVFEALLTACHSHRHRQLQRCRSCAARLAQAAALYRGDFLAEFSLADSQAFEEWELMKRESLHQKGLEALEMLAAYHERRGEAELAGRYARRQIELDPWREEAHRHLMRLLARAGQRSAALSQYETCRQVLAEALGVAPTTETRALYERIRDGTEPMGVPEATGVTVPRLPMPLVGRQAERQELAEWLENPAYQLITITGLGGIGKTSVALAVADELAGTFEAGAVFIPLAGLTSPEQLVVAVLRALNVKLQGAAEPPSQLATALEAREVLLVLDNFEQLLDADGSAVKQLAALIAAAPGVTLLVTSRERLGLRAERVFELEGLATPPSGGAAAGAAEDFSAVQLFVERARQTQRQFVLDAAEAAAVGRICQLVEGLPLAIEMAAAQARLYPCSVIAADLQAHLREYTTALHDVPERQRSLRATFEYSWCRLSPQEQTVLARLAVFEGGCELEAAERVAQATVEWLLTLSEKSLLRVSDATGQAAPAQRRFELHEVTRQYAAEKLSASGEAPTTRRTHAEYFLGLAEAAAPQLTGAEQVAWLDRLEREHANLRAALRWGLETDGQAELAGRMGGALWRFWWVHSHLVEGRGWLERIGALGDRLTPAIRANVLNGAGVLANDLGDYTAAQTHHLEALRLRQTLNDRLGMARSLGNLGNTARQLGERAQSRAYFTECLALFRELDHQWGIATTLLNLGVMAEDEALDEQAALYTESMELYRQLGDGHGMSLAIGNLGEIALRRRNFAEARQRYAEYIELAQTLGNMYSVAHSLMMLGIVAIEAQDVRRGVRGFGAAARLREAAGIPVQSAYQGEYERYVGMARTALGEAPYQTAWAAGQALTTEQAIAEALDTL